jgi:hypothetical protein
MRCLKQEPYAIAPWASPNKTNTDEAAASRHDYDIPLLVRFGVTDLRKIGRQRFAYDLCFFCFHNTPPSIADLMRELAVS